MLANLSTRRFIIVHTVGLLLHFLSRLAHHKCVFCKGSERLQAVISAPTSGKFYRLPPDKENPDRSGKKERISKPDAFHDTLIIKLLSCEHKL